MGRHELPFTPKTITMEGAWQAAARSACKAFSLYKPCFNCSRRVPTALGLAGRAGRLPGLARSPHRRCWCGGGTAQLSSPLRWGSWPASLCPHRPAHSHAHLILLGELQPIVGLQPIDVVGEVRHRDGGVVTHACKQDKEVGGRGKRLRLCMAKEGSTTACEQQTRKVGARRTRVTM